MALGFCERCYSNHDYHRNRGNEVRKRKLKRLQMSEEKAAAKYEQERRWKESHREQALLKQKEHYLRNKATINKWPIGSVGYYELLPNTWIAVEVIEVVNSCCKVRTKTGAVIATSFKKVKKSPPYLYRERDVA